MTDSLQWAVVFREVAVGLGVFLVGLGILVACVRLGRLLSRLGITLDEVDRQVAALGTPVARTLDHVNGIANTADATIARVGDAVGQLETVAASAAKGAGYVGSALAPAVNNVGSTLGTLTARLRAMIRRDGEAREQPEAAPSE